MNLEHQFPNDWDVTRRNFEKLASLVLDTGGTSAGLRFGADSWAFPGGAPGSGAKAVTHGLGRVPVAVFVQTANRFINWDVTLLTDTTFTTTGVENNNNNVAAGSINFYWVVIG